MNPETFTGVCCGGNGDAAFLRLIDDSWRMMRPAADLPNISMIYHQATDTFREGFFWNGWWIQNSYGFAYGAVPFLTPLWLEVLQRSLDLFWDRIGDGKRRGAETPRKGDSPLMKLVAPDGSLGDCVAFGQGIIYKQGDGDIALHDWFYEAAAAGVVMQSEILLRQRDREKTLRYLPLMKRSCDFIESIRDPGNGLFLAGPASNLLAPSYGGAPGRNGKPEKGYPAGIAVTYTAALRRMADLYLLCGDTQGRALCMERLKRNDGALRALMAPEGYFAKSADRDGTLHGVYGAGRFGYLEGVVNADAMAFGVPDRQAAEGIYRKIREVESIRPFGFLLTNYPELDDTYVRYAGKEHEGFFRFGDWVNGGCWATVEGRAILGYYRLGRFGDVLRSASLAMKWAREYRMDAPFSQRGENTFNPWSDRKGVSPVSVMVDNFAIPAATIRGLFEYEYTAGGLMLRPHIPDGITFYTQREPVYWGSRRLFLSAENRGEIKAVFINGKKAGGRFRDEITLDYDALPERAHIYFSCGESAPGNCAGCPPEKPAFRPRRDLPFSDAELSRVHKRCLRLYEELEAQPDSPEKACAAEALMALEACADRRALPFGPGELRPWTTEKIEAAHRLYETAALALAEGLLPCGGG